MRTVFAFFALAIPAFAAAILPAPITSTHCAVDKITLDDPVHCVLGNSIALASLAIFPFVSMSVQAVGLPVDVNGSHGAGASATVQYFFQVLGNPGDIVPILIATQLSTTGSHPSLGIGSASLLVHTTAAGDVLAAACSDGSCGGGSTFSGTLSTRARTGDINTLTLNAGASAGGNLSSQSATAFADPFIFIDPSFPTASLYSIAVSPGVGNAAAVPEPATAALAILGALALIARRRRAPTAPSGT